MTLLLDPAADDRSELIEKQVSPCLRLLDRLESQLLSKLPSLEQEQEKANQMVRYI